MADINNIKNIVANGTKFEIREFLHSISSDGLEFSDALYAALGFYKLADLENAIRVLTNAVVDDEKIVPIRFQRGIYEYEADHFEAAHADFEFVIESEIMRGEDTCLSEAAFYNLLIANKKCNKILVNKYFALINDGFQSFFEDGVISKEDILKKFVIS